MIPGADPVLPEEGFTMRRLAARLSILALLASAVAAAPQEGALLHSMDDARVQNPKEKGRAETVEGKVGKAVKFSFDAGCKTQFCSMNLRATPEWDKAEGFSFWLKGDGSKHFGCLQFIWNEDYAARYDVAFPLDSTEWRKITVAWRDLVPVLPAPSCKFLDPKAGNAPSKLGPLWFGKWWYWRDDAAHSYTIDEIRLEPTVAADTNLYLPKGNPLERIQAKVKAGKPVTIVTMGDSLTDYNHWANKPINWPTLLKEKLKQKGVEARIINPAIGGTQLRQGLVQIPLWVAEAPEPDLVTVCYGANDWESGMRGEMFRETCRETIDRIRRATKGKADVLFLTTVPGLEMWSTRAELGDAVRASASERKCGLADTEKAFNSVASDKRTELFCRDKVHLGPPGHETVAAAVLAAIEAGK
jgi:lysophospholipase L1-like esterase